MPATERINNSHRHDPRSKHNKSKQNMSFACASGVWQSQESSEPGASLEAEPTNKSF